MIEPHDELMVMSTGGGSERERLAAVDHVRGCAACLAAAPKLGVALEALEAEGLGREVSAVPAGGLERLLARTRGGRLSYFASRVAVLFDLSDDAALELLTRAERDDAWDEGPGPGVFILTVNAGPKVPEALTALVKLAPGATFPRHPHFGPERVMVLEGGYRDSGGVEVWRGEVQDMAAGTEHDFIALDGFGCVCASVNALMPT